MSKCYLTCRRCYITWRKVPDVNFDQTIQTWHFGAAQIQTYCKKKKKLPNQSKLGVHLSGPGAQAVAKVDRECSPKIYNTLSEQVRLSKSQLVR